MIFTETKLKGSFLIEIERQTDERGFFARIWDKKKFEENGLNSKIVQCSISFNKKIGILRGMHYQISPYAESRIVRCTKGKIFDVIIDLRANSNTFKKWLGIELSGENRKMLYVPEGFAHGFITLEDNTEVFYQMSQFYEPNYSRGVRWDDNAFGIIWPMKPITISEKDKMYSDFPN